MLMASISAISSGWWRKCPSPSADEVSWGYSCVLKLAVTAGHTMHTKKSHSLVRARSMSLFEGS